MPNLINTDNAGNVFYNYITPAIKGEAIGSTNTPVEVLDDILIGKFGAEGTYWKDGGSDYNFVKFLAPGLEMKTGSVLASADNRRCMISPGTALNSINSSNITTAGSINVNTGSSFPRYTRSNPHKVFSVINDYAYAQSVWDANLTICDQFLYVGWLREPSYTGGVSPAGFVVINSKGYYIRPLSENTSTSQTLSTAADAITSPPIVCTAGTDPGDGSETFTDIVIRDAAAPNNPVGKLWNCIDMPATCNVGELWRNTGVHDGDASASEQDTYLCVMPWGTRKLGMRVWTENVS